MVALFVGLDVADLAAVCTFARRARPLLRARLGGALGVGVGHVQARTFLKHSFLFLALVPSFFVLLEPLLFFLRPSNTNMVSVSGLCLAFSPFERFSPSGRLTFLEGAGLSQHRRLTWHYRY